jgi:hypothetical protein
MSGGYASLGRLTPLESATSVSVSFDLRRAEGDGGGRQRLFWTDRKFALDLIGDRLELRVMQEDGTFAAWRTEALDWGEGAWRSAAFTLDGATGTARLYVDGAEALTRAGVDFGFDATGLRASAIGGGSGGAMAFDGAIADVRVFERAVYPSRIETLADVTPRAAAISSMDDAAATTPGATVAIDALGNDRGAGSLRVVAAGDGAAGRVEIVGGALRYTPPDGFQGVDRFSYTAADQSGAVATAAVEVAVGTVVDGAAALMAALRAAQGGETILLAPGDYGRLALDGRSMAFAAYAAEVTIRSLDPSDMARFSGLALRSVRNLGFDSVAFDYAAAPGAADSARPFQIAASASVSIRDSLFDGDLARTTDPARAGKATGHGLSVRDSTDIEVTGSTFVRWMRGAVFHTSTDLTVTGNEVVAMRSDGMNFAGVQGVLIEGNRFRDFDTALATGDHPDMIQFWTNGTTVQTRDVIIRGNVLDSGSGDWTQSIFMRNELADAGRAGEDMFYANVLIEDNVIRNAHRHGVTVGQTLGLTIRNNTVAHGAATESGESVHLPRISVHADSREVSVTGNLAHGGPVAVAGWTVDGNMTIQRTDPGAADHYARIFADGLGDGRPADLALRALPGGVLETADLGARTARFDTRPDEVDGFIAAVAGRGLARDSVAFSLGGLFDAAGRLGLAGASATWDFGDGTVGAGLAPTHRFASVGVHEVKATATLADGRRVMLERTVEIESGVAARASFETGLADESPAPNLATVSGGASLATTEFGVSARLRGGSDTVRFDATPDFFNNDSYTVLLDFRKATADGGGRLVYFANSFVLSVGADNLRADVTTDRGPGVIRATAPSLQEVAWRNVALTFDGATGIALLYLDGRETGRLTGLEGAMQRGGLSQDLHLGGPFGSSFDGHVDNFAFLRGALDADAVREAYLAARAGPGSPDFAALAAPEADFGF